ncbi:MAG: nitroreductase family protein [Chloroflexi bacterium]|nr:nitroreductase family protein [Chloroflexota bacterium]
MDVLEAIRTRRSIRRYKKEPVPPELVAQILEAGRWAPSADNSQPWRFIVLEDALIREKCARLLYWGRFLARAPLGIAITVDPQATSCPIQDGALAAGNILLACHALGLGACWLDPTPTEEALVDLLAIPKGQVLVTVISIGYPDASPMKHRKKLCDLTYRNQYGNKWAPQT